MTTKIAINPKYDHLIPYQWKKGESGNPKGRTPGHRYSVRTVLEHALSRGGLKLGLQKMKEKGIDVKDGTHADLIAVILLYKAEVLHDLDAIKTIIKETDAPLAKEFDPEDPNPDVPSIHVTRTVVYAQNVQINNGKQIAPGAWIQSHGGGNPTIYGGDPLGICADCNRLMACGKLKGIFNPEIKCGGQCKSARGHTCECSCGGLNHGISN